MRALFKIFIIGFLIIQYFSVTAQNGKVVLIGGGMERSQTNAWNYQVFDWIVNNASNKRVAVIGQSAGDGWLEEKFVDIWGANYSKEFVINASNADNQQIYDSLITYNAVYMRGGDQYYYYNWYKNTKTQQALEFIFNNGGVVAGTSAGLHVLTEIIFTDDTGYGLFPFEAIENPTHSYMTLHNDFLGLVSESYGDSHFSERGRFPRLVGIMGNRWLTESELITGIGIDDLTALAIDGSGIATVYGTGCANIYIASDTTFSRNPAVGGKLLAKNIRVIQLLQGCAINLNTMAITQNLPIPVSVPLSSERGNFTILLSGGNTLSENELMLQDFFNSLPGQDSPVLMLTGSSASTANQFKTRLETLGATNVSVKSAVSANGTSSDLAQDIQNAEAFLFVNNTWSSFNSFLSTANGTAMINRLKEDNMLSGFVGDNSRFAGAKVVENYLNAGASYYAEMIFQNGLSLLATTVIMPNSFSNSNMYENAVTAVPYAMTNHGLAFGVWLYNKNYLKYDVQNNASWFTSYGTGPAMILKNTSAFRGNSQQTSTGSGTPRQITGFDRMELSLIDESVSYQVGDSVFASVADFQNPAKNNIRIYPNPATDLITIETGNNKYFVQIFNITGSCEQTMIIHQQTVQADISSLSPGVYILKATDILTGNVQIHKLIVQ